MLVVAEDHQLREVQVAAELGIRESRIVHTMILLQHAAMIIGHLHLDKYQRQSVDQKGYIRAEAFAAILTRHLSDTLPYIILGIIVVDHFICLV